MKLLIVLIELYAVYALQTSEAEKIITDIIGSEGLASFIIISMTILILLHAVSLVFKGSSSGDYKGGGSGGFFDGGDD